MENKNSSPSTSSSSIFSVHWRGSNKRNASESSESFSPSGPPSEENQTISTATGGGFWNSSLSILGDIFKQSGRGQSSNKNGSRLRSRVHPLKSKALISSILSSPYFQLRDGATVLGRLGGQVDLCRLSGHGMDHDGGETAVFLFEIEAVYPNVSETMNVILHWASGETQARTAMSFTRPFTIGPVVYDYYSSNSLVMQGRKNQTIRAVPNRGEILEQVYGLDFLTCAAPPPSTDPSVGANVRIDTPNYDTVGADEAAGNGAAMSIFTTTTTATNPGNDGSSITKTATSELFRLWDATANQPLSFLEDKLDLCRYSSNETFTIEVVAEEEDFVREMYIRLWGEDHGNNPGGSGAQSTILVESIDRVAPFTLGGMKFETPFTLGTVNAVSILSKPGTYTIEAMPLPPGDVTLGMSFEVGYLSCNAVGTQLPTTEPASTNNPTMEPTRSLALTLEPTVGMTSTVTTAVPSTPMSLTAAPTVTMIPIATGTTLPTITVTAPTTTIEFRPTIQASNAGATTNAPNAENSASPSNGDSLFPTSALSFETSSGATEAPSNSPSTVASQSPSVVPTIEFSASPSSLDLSLFPTVEPSSNPSSMATTSPSGGPTNA